MTDQERLALRHAVLLLVDADLRWQIHRSPAFQREDLGPEALTARHEYLQAARHLGSLLDPGRPGRFAGDVLAKRRAVLEELDPYELRAL